mmetsp:Transcript_15611/g.23946  ORF Transcript_15611/g.23946 Transcript_15611/m.23946 type:complete len:83 (+) Transcript_15611:1689-1937(+)
MTHNSTHVPSNKNVKVLMQKQTANKKIAGKADTNMELVKSSEGSNETKREKLKSSNFLPSKTLSLSRMEHQKKIADEEVKEL